MNRSRPPTSASAATYTFDLQKAGSYHGDGDAGPLVGNTLTIDQNGGSGTLTGMFSGKYVVDPSYSGTTLSGDVQNADSVQRHNNGLGVCNVGPCAPRGDVFHTVDGASSNEDGPITDVVEMSFFSGTDAVDVTLQSLTFGWIGNAYGYGDGSNLTGAFEVLVSDLSETAITAGATQILSGVASGGSGMYGLLGTYDFPDLAAFTDNLFGVKAGIGGSWKLTAATVYYTPSVPEIPLPAAGWLMLAGMGSIAAMRRKKS